MQPPLRRLPPLWVQHVARCRHVVVVQSSMLPGGLVSPTTVSGDAVGLLVGALVGLFTGALVGDFTTGALVGDFTGAVVGDLTGAFVGDLTGDLVGSFTGDLVGGFTGAFVGGFTGDFVGGFTGGLVGGSTLVHAFCPHASHSISSSHGAFMARQAFFSRTFVGAAL